MPKVTDQFNSRLIFDDLLQFYLPMFRYSYFIDPCIEITVIIMRFYQYGFTTDMEESLVCLKTPALRMH